MDAFACAEKLQAETGVDMPEQVAQLCSLPVRHTACCPVESMEETLLGLLK